MPCRAKVVLNEILVSYKDSYLDLGKVSEWCNRKGMKLNASKTIGYSPGLRTMHPESPPLTVGGTVLNKSDDPDVFGLTFDSKKAFQNHFRSVSRIASHRLDIFRKSWRVFNDKLLFGSCCCVIPA